MVGKAKQHDEPAQGPRLIDIMPVGLIAEHAPQKDAIAMAGFDGIVEAISDASI